MPPIVIVAAPLMKFFRRVVFGSAIFAGMLVPGATGSTGDNMTEGEARVNRITELARNGDRPMLQELVDTAVRNPPKLFAPNRVRDTAISILDGLLATSPDDVDLLVLRAQAENAPTDPLVHGASKEAFAWIEKALVLDPAHGRALLVRGLFRLNPADGGLTLRDSGYADLDRAFQLGAVSAEAYQQRAARAMLQEDFAAAAADLSEALRLRPDDLELLGLRARAYERQKNWPKAYADHDRLVELSPTKISALSNRADAHLTGGEYVAAVADFAAAIALDPENANFFLGRAQAHRLQGNRDLALADYQQARGLDPQLPALAADWSNATEIEALRHDVQRAFGQFVNASKAVNEAALEMIKTQKELTHNMAQLHRSSKGEDRTAEQILAEVEQSEKDQLANATDYRDRPRALVQLKHYDDALAALSQAITLDDTDAGARDLRGQLYETRRDNERAATDYDRALELMPKNADYHRHRGDFWMRREDFVQAFFDYEAAVTSDGKNPDNWFGFGNAKYNLGRWADAVMAYDKVLALKPDYPDAQKNREAAQRGLATH